VSRFNLSILCLRCCLVVGSLASCGTVDKSSYRSEPKPKASDLNPLRPYLLRARAVIDISSHELEASSTDSETAQNSSMIMQRLSVESYPIEGVVPARIVFDLAIDRFSAPEELIDVASYGFIDVVDLFDNSLRVCGESGREQCASASIHIFTSGTPEDGLWSEENGYGLPILTDTNTVGLDPEGAVTVSQVDVSLLRVLRMSNFTADGRIPIPIAVDFSDAGAGSYSSRLVIEYVLR